LAVVRTERGYGIINTAGEWVMEDRWADIVWHGEENIITATEDGTTWHIYNRRGHQISYYGCHGFGTPSDGYIVARWKEKFGYYTTEGEKVVDFIYEQAGSFHKGFALVRYNGRTYHIDTTFHRIGSVQEQLLAEGKI
ncbi:MAG: WG repeat-containing protein, partial [Tidjanibacter sp.]|nr:WG repeat-containing protein [Tidjanibacter sp.]